jgi:hypothetical protein
MKKKLAVVGLTIVIFAGAAFAVGSSASYKITTEILDSGAASGSSATYRVLGKARQHEINSPASSGFTLGGGFMKSAYFGAAALAPVVISIAPNTGANSGPVNITNLGGANFLPGATVKLSKSGQADIIATSVAIVNVSQITCTFDLTGAASGLWNVTVTNTDGRSGTLPSAFTVTFAAPTVTSITPNTGVNNAVVNISNLAGTNFRSGAAVKLSKTGESDIIGANIVISSATQITCQFDLNGKTAGLWDVVVTNEDGQSGTLTQGFAITTPTITVTKPIASDKPVFDPAKGPMTLSVGLSKATDDAGNPITIFIYVYSIRGERIYQTSFPARVGDNSVTWDGLTAFKSYLSSGVYIVQVVAKTADGKSTKISETKIIVSK